MATIHIESIELSSGLCYVFANSVFRKLHSQTLVTSVSIRLEMGLRAHASGDLEAAKLHYESVLAIDPSNVSANGWLGTIEAQRKNFSRARALLERALSGSDDPDFLLNYANLLQETGEYDQALTSYLKVVKKRRSQVTLSNLAACYNEMNQPELGLGCANQSLAIDPNYAEAWSNRGGALRDLRRHEEALASHERSIELKPDSAEAWSNRGVALGDLRRHEEALASHERSIELKPDYAKAWSNRGVTLGDLRRHEEALASYERAIALKPDYAEAWSNRGAALNALRRHEEALASYDQSIELKPDYTEAWSNRGVVLLDLRRHEEALASFERAIELKPDYAEAWLNRGVTLNDLRRHEEALASYERAIELKPDADYVLGNLVHTQMKLSDWTDLLMRCRTLESKLLTADRACSPLSVLGLFDDPHLQRQCAELHAKKKFGFESELGPIVRRSKKDKIRVGYFSMDFREHPVAHLMAELIETHDRDKFEIYGFSFGTDTGDSMRKRLEMAFDKFLEVRHLSDLDIARLARDHEIDIAIDLGGYTQDSRPAIFAHRATPIQINYLGFPGTMGTEHLDYFIGDRVTVTEKNIGHFSEKIIFLPNSFQANPSQRPIGSQTPSRATYGLPDSGFVFCCFNNVWKITPDIFKVWASILRKVKGSVLWLQDGGDVAKRSLSRELEFAGISADRIVFAGRLPCLSDHLSRYRLADLFLDTFPYGAHTTASDALWVGLPVLTQAGESFASRVASSLLNAVGLPELITHTTEQYESLAIELANNPEKLSSLKARLAENRATCPLFNTALFTQHIESAYQTAYDRYHEGLAPDHIYVRA